MTGSRGRAFRSRQAHWRVYEVRGPVFGAKCSGTGNSGAACVWRVQGSGVPGDVLGDVSDADDNDENEGDSERALVLVLAIPRRFGGCYIPILLAVSRSWSRAFFAKYFCACVRAWMVVRVPTTLATLLHVLP